VPDAKPDRATISELAQKLRGTELISHSQSGIYPFQVTALLTQGVAGIISIEPGRTTWTSRPAGRRG
jgi:hypothetical protein